MAEPPASPVAGRARFDRIRYAQVWEDADLLLPALGEVRGERLLSVAAAGDNALAMLLLDPAEVVAADLSEAQLNCLRLRLAAIPRLGHTDFLALMGARAAPPRVRVALMERALADAPGALRDFWLDRARAVGRHGAGGVGKFERYFRQFARYVLPLAQPPEITEALFEPRAPLSRKVFYAAKFDTWRWRLLMRAFFSRPVMARLGRDKAFFAHVEGSVADHVMARVRHALTELDPADNPFLHWIVTGNHGAALPLAWRAEHYDTLRARLSRIRLYHGAVETAPVAGVAGANLSDIFEYMSEAETAQALARIVERARPGARLVYWNMMAPRRGAEIRPDLLAPLPAVAMPLKPTDKAFFYDDFVVEAVR
ncbi:S-adenosylmethionine-diacylglycerol 3-amino-3-carboxypropyl transferase [Rhodovulum iodosum]|uniref:S-adenosylmethionine-diacylglycerol 3-amino-3-carboxypropyl transferase n=1 Tax=Rhodovulum iodosum TaxID=68291 RepID=A0ABV3XPE3_9RHOB|nr:DUF3419 family protein [Rhodovulum robiginosum]RSK31528.1 DUF3419 family protein [Rhodovulum robiginosum]